MKLVWCPETAHKAYIDAVTALAGGPRDETSVAELVAGMAGGWRAQLIVEFPACNGLSTTSTALATAVRHTHGRHVCVVPDEPAAKEYATAAAEVVAGEAEEAMGAVEGVDFMVVDWRRRDAVQVVRGARAGPRGMVVVCENARGGGLAAAAAGPGKRLVRTAFLPIGRGVEILHVGTGKGPSLGGAAGGRRSRWVKHVDRDTGEEHLFRR